MVSVRGVAKPCPRTRYLSVTLAFAIVAAGLTPVGGASTVVYASDITPPPAPPAPNPIIGFIDTHLHQFANLGFGGYEVWGSPMDPSLDAGASLDDARARALPDSDYIYVGDDQIGSIRAAFGIPVTSTPSAAHGNYAQCPSSDPCWRVSIHGNDGNDDLLNSVIQHSSHDTNGYRASGSPDAGMQWPAWNVVTTQQAYWEWLQRAHQHGLKMITMTAVNNAVLCNVGIGFVSYQCDDDSAVARQIQGAKDLEAYIDARSGGTGQGFYRIVYNSAQARQVIQQGKMAVMLGVEVDTPRGCASNVDCSDQVASLVQDYYNMGVRVVYPVHVVDNAFGGSALYNSLFEFDNYIVNGHHFWNVTTTCGVGDPMALTWRDGIRDTFTPGFKIALVAVIGVALAALGAAFVLGLSVVAGAFGALAPLLGAFLTALPILALVFGVAGASISAADLVFHLVGDMVGPDFGPVGAAPDPNCNSRALTAAGEALINDLIDHRMLIDVDHTDRLGFDRILQIAESRHYPGIVSGHTGLVGASTANPPNLDDSGRHEGNKTDQMVQRINSLGGFISLIPHQGGRSRVRDISSAFGAPYDCGNSSESWAQVYLYATQDLGLNAVGIGSDFNGFAGWSAPRFGPDACAGDHPASYSPTNGVQYGPSLVDYFGNPLPQYTFGNKTWNFNTDGLAHVGMLPDFIADLQAQGLGSRLGPLFNSVEAYVKMWEKVDDVTAPTVRCGTVGEDWHADDVSVPCNAFDLGWGLRNASDANFSLTTAVANGTESDNASTGTHAAVCDAGSNCSSTVAAIAGINVDKKDPTVTITMPGAGTPTFTLSQVVPSNYSCADGGSGIATCAGPVPSGTAIDTSIGSHTFTVQAVDKVGHTVNVSRPYNVAFAICVLYDQTKVRTAGSTVPVKLQLCDAAGANVSSASLVVQATGVKQVSSTVTGTPDDSGSANPDNAFRFDAASGAYVYNLSTRGLTTGTYALSFTASGDPTTHTVQFQLR